MDSHAMSKFTTGSVKRPVIAGTKKLLTLKDSNYNGSSALHNLVERNQACRQSAFDDPLYVHQPEPPNFPKYSKGEDVKLQNFTMNRESLTAEFYQKLSALKQEHKKTLRLMDDLYQQSDQRRCHSSLCYNNKDWNEGMQDAQPISYRDNSYNLSDDLDNEPLRVPVSRAVHSEESSADSNKSDSETQEDNPPSHFNVDQYQVSLDSTAEDRISRMWDNFSLDSCNDDKVVKARNHWSNRRPKSAAATHKKKEWSPIITIPKPFKMTLREEAKREKTHTKSSIAVAQQREEQRRKEEQETSFQIRAREPPAHIYLPLYEEFRERQEQRSRFNKENAILSLMAIQEPFSFAERDEKKRKIKEQEKKKEEARKLREIKRMAEFEAMSVPFSVHDPAVSDRIIEEKLYRRIKKKMRSEDLMKISELPPRMQAHELMAKKKREAWQRAVEREAACSFQPETHSVPDFEALHRREQFESQYHRGEIETTSFEPFSLRTTERSRKKLEKKMVELEDKEMAKKKTESKRQRSKTAPYCSVTDTIPARLTDASRLRIETMRRSLQDAERVIQRAKEDEEERKERRRSLAQKVLERTSEAEIPLESTADRDEKLKKYKKQLRERQIEYNKFLEDVRKRVDGRPLLFEQHAEKVAKQQAEKRYREILESSGLSDDFVTRKSRHSVSSDDSLALKSHVSTRKHDNASDSEDDILSPLSTRQRKASQEDVAMTTNSWQQSDDSEDDDGRKTKKKVLFSSTKTDKEDDHAYSSSFEEEEDTERKEDGGAASRSSSVSEARSKEKELDF